MWLLQGSLQRQHVLMAVSIAQHDSLLQLVNEETSVRGFVATGDPRFLEIYYQSLPQAVADAKTVTVSLSNLPELQSAAQRSQALADTAQGYLANEIGLARVGNIARARSNLSEGKAIFDRYRRAHAIVELEVGNEFQSQINHTQFLARAGFVAGIVLCAALLLGATAFVVLVRRASGYRASSMRDPLTGATNRRGALNGIRALIRAESQNSFALVFIDLDGFKKINDTYGHAAGDAILKDVVLRLRTELRDIDEVCRIGGDEFLCIVAPPVNTGLVKTIASRLRDTVTRPYSHQHVSYVVGCSIGVSMYPQDGTSAEALIESADRAMYAAKAAGGGIRVSEAR